MCSIILNSILFADLNWKLQNLCTMHIAATLALFCLPRFVCAINMVYYKEKRKAHCALTPWVVSGEVCRAKRIKRIEVYIGMEW